jgi:hypothetical protein
LLAEISIDYTRADKTVVHRRRDFFNFLEASVMPASTWIGLAPPEMSWSQLPLFEGDDHLLPHFDLVIHELCSDGSRQFRIESTAEAVAFLLSMLPIPVIAVDDAEVGKSRRCQCL